MLGVSHDKQHGREQEDRCRRLLLSSTLHYYTTVGSICSERIPEGKTLLTFHLPTTMLYLLEPSLRLSGFCFPELSCLEMEQLAWLSHFSIDSTEFTFPTICLLDSTTFSSLACSSVLPPWRTIVPFVVNHPHPDPRDRRSFL